LARPGSAVPIRMAAHACDKANGRPHWAVIGVACCRTTFDVISRHKPLGVVWSSRTGN